MSRTSKITPEIELEVIERYTKGEEKVTSIAGSYGFDPKNIYDILKKHGIGLRKPNRSSGKPRSKKRHCDCGVTMPAEAKYCYMCGKSLKTDEEIIIDGLLFARGKAVQHVPAGIKSDVDRKIMAAVNLLKEKCGVK